MRPLFGRFIMGFKIFFLLYSDLYTDLVFFYLSDFSLLTMAFTSASTKNYTLFA